MTDPQLTAEDQAGLREQLRVWREDLIDLSKRNRLLWFRATGTTTFELRQPELREIYARIMEGGSWGFHLPPGPDEPREDPQWPGREPRPDDLVTDKADSEVIRRGLRNLERRTSQAYMDTGLWTLHLGLGMLRWRSPDEPEDAHSPLLLVPVGLERASRQEPLRLRRVEGDLALNPSLGVKLQTDLGVTLPDLDPEEATIDAVLAAVAAACRQWPDWSIEERAVLGAFSFQKEAMYRDLLDNEEQILERPAIQVLGLGRDKTGGFAFSKVPDEELDEAMPPERLSSILDADASQRQCIKAAVDGRSFVMDGPPGTGKSQTIANMVAELIGRGQTVLFVSEKAAALDVVQTRLAAAGLGEFLLPLHSHKATRKEVAVELGRALFSQPIPGPRLDEGVRERLLQRRRALTAYVQAVNERRPSLGRTLNWAFGRIAQLHYLPRVAWWSGAAEQLSMERFGRIQDTAERLARAWGPVARGDDFLWRDVAFDRYDGQLAHQLRGEVDAARLELDRLREAAGQSAERTGLPWAASPIRTRDLAELEDRLAARHLVPLHWLSQPKTAQVRERVDQLESEWGRRQAMLSEAEVEVGARWRDLQRGDLDVLSRALDECRRSPVPWRLADSAGVSETDTALQLARHLPEQLGWLRSRAQMLLRSFGGGGEPTLSQVRALADIAGMASAPNRPEALWLNPLTLSSLDEAARVLGALVDRYRAHRAELTEVFTDGVLELDLETLCPRFEQVYRGPLKILKSNYRADRTLLRSATRLGRVDGRVRALLRNALEWQRLTRQLELAERQHAGVIGSRYYRGRDTDFQALTEAVGNARRAVDLAGGLLDRNRVASQIAAEATPDPEVDQVRADVASRLEWLMHGLRTAMPGSEAEFLDASLPTITESAERAREPLEAVCEVLARVGGVAGRAVDLEGADHALELRDAIAEVEDALQNTEDSDDELLGTSYRGSETDWAALREAVTWTEELLRLTGQLDQATASRLMDVQANPGPLRDRLRSWEQAAGRLLARFREPQKTRLWRRLISSYEEGTALLDQLSRTVGDAEEWLQHLERIDELDREGLSDTVAGCVAQGVTAGQVPQLVERALLEGWADRLTREDPRVRDARSADRDRLVEDFRELDRELIRRSAAEVITRCNDLRPQSTVGQAGVIQAQANLKRRHMAIRRLLTQAGEVAKRLKPCFMMSPLSVSSFLPSDMRFDVVVFDEASQVRPCDAINCIYRGDRLIVAGDQRQLPPTSFFDASFVDGEDGDDEALGIYDSILDQCKGAGFSSLSLLWHYRSQHEALIAFSNGSFYDGRLLTFPGAVTAAPDLGVELRRVPGQYRPSPYNDNPAEAEVVAQRVIHYADLNLRREEPLSVGVVTFSQRQEDAVQRAVDNAVARRPDLEPFFAGDRLNRFFVKNLETVQGDERDVMIFSVGYARDSAGRFAMRFGPLSAEGGERRLNVAVTRARRRVEVIASVGPEDFSGEIREGSGAWHLREYLAYVERGGVLVEAPRASGRSFDSPLEESVARTIESWGYEVVPQVGMASYRVDLGVRRPEDRSRYLLGVECDGAMYHSSKVARDRDRLRQQALERLGWTLHRVWSPAWYRDRHGEEQRLLAALESAATEPATIPVRRERPVADGPETQVRVVELPRDESPPPWTRPYRAVGPRPPGHRMEMHLEQSGGDIRRMVMEVAEVEAPVATDLVLRRVREAWGVGSAGSRIQANFNSQLGRLQREGRLRLVGSFIWLSEASLDHVRVPSEGEPMTVRRVEHIPPQELDAALAHVTAEAVAGSEDDLTERVARVFGWRRRGPDIGPALRASVNRLVQAGHLERRGGALHWVGGALPNLGARRVTEQVVETPPVEPVARRSVASPPRRPIASVPAPPSPPPTAAQQVPSPLPAADTARPAVRIPADVDRCLTPGGHEARQRQLQEAEERMRQARASGDDEQLRRAGDAVGSLRRLLEEVRVLPAPTGRSVVTIGCLVGFREEGAAEETWQLVPPLEADIDNGKMSVMTPIGQALFGHSPGDLVEVEAPSGSYRAEVLSIELP
ncbi:MAG: DUF3320 domain-containing protein [Candidatus Dormibacteraeota bacterium]|nr:DUF3320 domain-containing protein [Candidatus Dormibacteraeota bacterium]